MEKIIKQINISLSKHQWCDFEIIQLKGNLIIGGRTSFDKKFDIIITFKNIFFLQCLYEWKTDTSIPAFYIPEADEQHIVNGYYSIEQGYRLIKILAEDIEKPMYIACEKIEYNIEYI
ncbi:MAG: hypothetical protein LUH10_09220 [Tannerellaceae bacterium]|nr:hypothetical protein [Tannerellaceae bacterium]